MARFQEPLADRLQTIISILIIVPVGFYSKFYSGLAQDWVRDSLGGVFYVMFWCLVMFLFFPALKNGMIAAVSIPYLRIERNISNKRG